MNYDNAYSALVDGKRARRQSWAVKRRCIYLVPESVVPFENIRTPHVTAETTGREAAHISSHVDMICDDGTIGSDGNQPMEMLQHWIGRLFNNTNHRVILPHPVLCRGVRVV